MSLKSLMNPAGGVRYHLRARRYAKELWQPYRWALGEYLLSWRPVARTLLLVGPSGGYCMQPFVFERFERVVCLEPDPLARWIFRKRLEAAPLESRPQLEFVAEDHLVASPERLPRLAASLGDCAVLFSNILGQLRSLLGIEVASDPRLERVREAVRETTASRAFFSFHDRVSGRAVPLLRQPYVSASRLPDEALVERFFVHYPGRQDHDVVELLDHLTCGFFDPSLEHRYFSWQLEPGRFHLIEAVSATERPVGTATGR